MDLGAIRARLPPGMLADVDDLGALLLYAQLDMLHLDADALHDRLHHWSVRMLEPAMPGLSAALSFRHARPADPHVESELDLQEAWLGLEATLRLEPPLAGERVEHALAQLPELLRLVGASGRPSGWRQHDVGSME